VHRNEQKKGPRGNTNHGNAETPKAETTSTSTAAHTRLSTTSAPTAALGCWGGAEVLFAAAVDVRVADDRVADDDDVEVVMLAAAVVEAVEELVDVVRPAVVALAEVDAEGPLRYAGGGTALEGSFSAPVPQGMASPLPGWTALGGGTVLPSAPEMANRVVHILVLVRGVENW
jgi:hypothetical protein